MMARTSRPPHRSYGITGWSQSFLAVFDQSQHRRVAKARTYFRDRHVHALSIGSGLVTATVAGSQLDPFETTLRTRTVDAATVVNLLISNGALDDLSAVARGEQPSTLGGFVAPTESADIAASCTCPIEDTCIHVLAVAYEVAAQIDRRSETLLTVMGADLSDLFTYRPDAGAEPSDGAAEPLAVTDFFGDSTPLPALPSPPQFHAFTELDAGALRTALRTSGVAALDVSEATDELAALYEAITT